MPLRIIYAHVKSDGRGKKARIEAILQQLRDPKSKLPQSFSHAMLPKAQHGQGALNHLASVIAFFEQPFGIDLGFAQFAGSACSLFRVFQWSVRGAAVRVWQQHDAAGPAALQPQCKTAAFRS